ncbi:hypothetical protein PM082_006514 [Marasmius tenuissimus]|nr:hypothetical protein PM082_006514 [Marasmius tenuissimus]
MGGPSLLNVLSAHIREGSLVVTSLSISLSSLVLLLTLVATIHPKARKLIDRVSFRLLVATIAINLANTIVDLYISGNVQLKDPPSCQALVWSKVFTGNFSSTLLLFIGLNLQLVMIHGVNGNKMERVYYPSAFLLAMVSSIPLFCDFDQYRWDSVHRMCAYTANTPERVERIGTQVFWPIFCILGEVATFVCIMVFMIRNKVFDLTFRKRYVESQSYSTSPCSSQPLPSVGSLFTPSKNRMIIFRIALYPLLAAFTLSVLVFNVFLVHTGKSNPMAFFVSATIVCSRPIVYAILAIFDPSMLRALGELRQWFLPRQSPPILDERMMTSTVRFKSYASSESYLESVETIADRGIPKPQPAHTKECCPWEDVELGEFLRDSEKRAGRDTPSEPEILKQI